MEDGSGSEAVRPRSFCAADYCRRRFWTHRKHLLALSRLISRLSLWQGLATMGGNRKTNIGVEYE